MTSSCARAQIVCAQQSQEAQGSSGHSTGILGRHQGKYGGLIRLVRDQGTKRLAVTKLHLQRR